MCFPKLNFTLHIAQSQPIQFVIIYKKAQKTKEVLEREIPETVSEIEYIKSVFDSLSYVETADDVKMIKDGETTAKEIGLTSREIPKKKFEDQHKTVDESKTMKLTFKNTTFLTEQHMLSRVPDNYKVEGKKFIMRDKMNHEYLVEWHVEDDPYVLNKTQINEQQNRIKELFNYKRGESNTTNAMRLTEDKKVNDMLNKARKLMM